MNSAHHGPWKVVHGESNVCKPMVSVVDSRGYIVCDNEQYYPTSLDPDLAPLIAAAPELLDALQFIRKANYGMEADVAEWIDGIIKKAEGEE